jgi:hypothetical protein
MIARTSQTNNTVTDGDIVAGNKITNNFSKKTKLSSLFERLKEEFHIDKRMDGVGENLKRFSEQRDTIGLEQKLIDGQWEYMLEDAAWYKQEYFKKLTRYQFFEPAQEIHAFLLGVVLEKFKSMIYPLIRSEKSHEEISKAISVDIVDPIVKTIQEEGCDDIMGLSAVDIQGMVFFLTGQCHIKWAKK